jgi:hypothetical protein
MFPGAGCIFTLGGEIGNGTKFDGAPAGVYKKCGIHSGGAVAQLAARLDGIEEVGGSNPPGSTKPSIYSL